ncbi:unnamed protein product [Effrenium voratum]|nr:unnamed protein product [Effrenium voratum]
MERLKWMCCGICEARSSKLQLQEATREARNEPETEPEEEGISAVKQQLLQRLNRMNTTDLLRKIRRNMSSFSSVAEDLSWDAEDIASEPEIDFAVRELRQYFFDLRQASTDTFWQRKSHKVVIAVVVCQREDGSLVPLRGMNTEVSLPSGSLCAERAGIASCASQFFFARSIKAIAVLDPSGEIAPLWPCEVCQSWLAKIRQESPRISVVAFPCKDDFKTILVQQNGKDVRPPRVTSRSSKHLVEH